MIPTFVPISTPLSLHIQVYESIFEFLKDSSNGGSIGMKIAGNSLVIGEDENVILTQSAR